MDNDDISGRTEDVHGNHTGYFYAGLPLRDLLAGMALVGLIAQSDKPMSVLRLAEESYKCADAMLKQRTETETNNAI